MSPIIQLAKPKKTATHCINSNSENGNEKIMQLTDTRVIETRLVDTVSIPLLLKTAASKMVDPSKLITHHFAFNDIVSAYEAFGSAAKEKTFKVILTNE